jgi:hypothetical protein
MAETWLTYTKLAELWQMSTEAARTRARRGRFQRRVGNDGQAEVLVDDAAPTPRARTPRSGGQTRAEPSPDQPSKESASAVLVKALEAHVASLKEEIAKADARADKLRQERDAERERVADLTSQLLKLTADILAARQEKRSWWARLVG